MHAEMCAFKKKLPQMLLVVMCVCKLIFSCTLPSNLLDNVDYVIEYMTACQLTHIYRAVRRCSGEEWSCDRNQG